MPLPRPTVLAGLLALNFTVAAVAADGVRVTIDTAVPGVAVAPTMHGLFFEDINYAADGGLYAELVQNRSFEHADHLFAWSEVARGGAAGELAVATDRPLNANNPAFLRLTVERPGERGYGAANAGYDGIAVKAGERYLFAVRARAAAGYAGVLRVVLEDAAGRALAEQRIAGLGADWAKYECALTSPETLANARLVVLSTAAGSVDIDVVSLFPEKTFKGRRNGLRADLAQALADLKPGFLRFPGGCIVEGADLANMYRWKDTIGDIAERKQNWNLWRTSDGPSSKYCQTYGLGFFEFFQFCEDIGAAPVPILNCGLSCQSRNGPAVPLDQLQPYVQDALDLIEFANGPATSTWGAKRAAMGHPEPFGLKMLGVGNEQWDEVYFERYAVFYAALKAKHPEISPITTTGPFPEDKWWKLAWGKFKSGTPADIVDEHYYQPPRWFLTHSDRYDGYDRRGPKVFVGEFAAHDGRRNNLRAALAEAAYMTGLWRNADVVSMAAYAPLFAKVGYTQWEPNLVWFDNTRVYGTPSYHVQAMFARNRPDVVLPVRLELPPGEAVPAVGRVGAGTWYSEAEFKDFRVERDGRTVYASDFARGSDGWELLGGAWTVVGGALHQSVTDKYDLRALADVGAVGDYAFSLKARRLGGKEGFLVFFETDSGELARWNLGGWDNTGYALDVPGADRQRIVGTLETGRWYDIRVELTPAAVKCYLDGRQLQEIARPKVERRPVPALFATAGRDDREREFVVQVVNPSARPVAATLAFAGAPRLGSEARLTVLTGRPADENSLDAPDRVVPRTETAPVSGAEFAREFPAYSATVLRIPFAPARP